MTEKILSIFFGKPGADGSSIPSSSNIIIGSKDCTPSGELGLKSILYKKDIISSVRHNANIKDCDEIVRSVVEDAMNQSTNALTSLVSEITPKILEENVVRNTENISLFFECIKPEKSIATLETHLLNEITNVLIHYVPQKNLNFLFNNFTQFTLSDELFLGKENVSLDTFISNADFLVNIYLLNPGLYQAAPH